MILVPLYIYFSLSVSLISPAVCACVWDWLIIIIIIIKNKGDGKIAAILDGGATGIGLESTVIAIEADPEQQHVVILRPGGVTLPMLEECLGPSGRVTLDPGLVRRDGKTKKKNKKHRRPHTHTHTHT